MKAAEGEAPTTTAATATMRSGTAAATLAETVVIKTMIMTTTMPVTQPVRVSGIIVPLLGCYHCCHCSPLTAQCG